MSHMHSIWHSIQNGMYAMPHKIVRLFRSYHILGKGYLAGTTAGAFIFFTPSLDMLNQFRTICNNCASYRFHAHGRRVDCRSHLICPIISYPLKVTARRRGAIPFLKVGRGTSSTLPVADMGVWLNRMNFTFIPGDSAAAPPLLRPCSFLFANLAPDHSMPPYS